MKKLLLLLVLLPFAALANSDMKSTTSNFEGIVLPAAVPPAYSGTFLVGSAQPAPFNTLTNAVNALNASGISASVTLILTDALYSNTTGEVFPITINAISGSSATKTVTIRPQTNMNVRIEATNINNYTGVLAVFKFNGADNVIIDGSNTLNSSTRNLTIQNRDNVPYVHRSVIWVASASNIDGATNITVKNTNVRMAFKNDGSTFCVGVYAGRHNAYEPNTQGVGINKDLAAEADNSGLTITNNDFMNVKQGIYINGGSVATTKVIVNLNDLGAVNNTETIIQPAYFSNVQGFTYNDNLIYNLYRNTTAGSLVSSGVYVIGNSKDGFILRNNIRNLQKTEADNITFAGIALESTVNASNIVVANNFIQDVAGSASGDPAQNGHGIVIKSGGGYKIYHNTVKMQANQVNPWNQTSYSSAFFVAQGVVGLDVRNNIFVNLQTVGIRRTAILVQGSISGSTFTHLDYNNYFSNGDIGYFGTNSSWSENPDYKATLAQWKAFTNKDAHSVSIQPDFVSVRDLHLSSSNSTLDNLGTAITGLTATQTAAIKKDIDGQLRNVTTPDMGADEFGSFAISPVGNAGIYCDASTTWNGTTWSNGLPTAEKDAVFTGNFTQNGGTFTACSMYVNSTAIVTFKGKCDAVITHTVNVEPTAYLKFESGSNLMQVENTQNSGNIVVQRFGSKLKRYDYSFWSSPVKGTQKLQEFSPATQSNRFYTYNTTTNSYMAVASAATTPFTTGSSYLIRMPDVITGQNAAAYAALNYRFTFEGLFTGVANNGTIRLPLQYTNDENSYNAVGNPYPSPISIVDFIDANLDNIHGTIWMWRKTNNVNETTYCAASKMGFIANSAPGGGPNNPDGNDLIADPFKIDSNGLVDPLLANSEGVLNTAQGFIVRAKNTNDLVFRNNMRKEINYDFFFRNGETEPENNAVVASRLWLNVSNAENTVFSQALIGYTQQATVGYDNGLDGLAFADATVSIYTLVDGQKIGIEARPAFTNEDVVALHLKTDVAGDLTMKLAQVDGIFAAGQEIYVKDNVTGILHDLNDGEFTFTTEIGTFENRFELMYKQPEQLGTVDNQIKETVIFAKDNQVKISATEEIKSVTVYDVNGRVLFQNNNVNTNDFTTSGLTASQQMVIVNTTFTSGAAVSKKIMMN